MLGNFLKSAGYSIEVTDSGEKALELCVHRPVDLVLSDLKMPGMSGLQLAEKLIGRDPERPVILMTAFGHLETAQEALRIGIYEYVTKPLDMHGLMTSIKNALEARRLKKEVLAYQRDLERTVAVRTRQLDKRVKELEARDALLKKLLFVSQPEETLELAVKLSISLCRCDIGAFYVPGEDGHFQRITALGWKIDKAFLDDFKLFTQRPDTVRELQHVFKEKVPAIVTQSTGLRRDMGIQSYALVPICKGDEFLAILEIGRTDSEDLMSLIEIKDIQDFAPYIALAVMELRLSKEPTNWHNDLDAVLEEAEKWTDI